MKSAISIFLITLFCSTAYAKCVVEILDSSGDPIGYVFQGDRCQEPMNRCKQQLGRLNNSGAKCEVTLDIGSKNTLE